MSLWKLVLLVLAIVVLASLLFDGNVVGCFVFIGAFIVGYRLGNPLRWGKKRQ